MPTPLETVERLLEQFPDTLTLGMAVAKGSVPGVSGACKFGYNPDVATSFETVWDVGGTYPYLSAATTLDVVSDDAADAAAGTARTSISCR